MKGFSMIYELDENGNIFEKAEYSIEPKAALICYIMQKQNNFNTWKYPKNISGIWESPTVKNHFYFHDTINNIVIASYPI